MGGWLDTRSAVHPRYLHDQPTASQKFRKKHRAQPYPSNRWKRFERFSPRLCQNLWTSLFGRRFRETPNCKLWDHAIELVPRVEAKGCKVYLISVSEQSELDHFLTENVETGHIRPSKSPMASPVFFIKKKDGSLRLVQDYQMLNDMTVKNKYLLPLISELVNQLRGARYFTKLDVQWGFNNVRIKEGDEWKAAFRTNRGMFECSSG